MNVRHRSSRAPGTGVMTTLALFASLAMAACGGSSGSTKVASLEKGDAKSAAEKTKASTPEEREKALLEFTACMRRNGIDMPDPETDADGNPRMVIPRDPAGIDREKLQKAQEECRDILDSADLGFDTDDPEVRDRMLKLSECMRDRGVKDFPDPDFSKTPPFDPAVVDIQDPDAQAAFQECAPDVFQGPPGSGGPGAGPGSDG